MFFVLEHSLSLSSVRLPNANDQGIYKSIFHLHQILFFSFKIIRFRPFLFQNHTCKTCRIQLGGRGSRPQWKRPLRMQFFFDVLHYLGILFLQFAVLLKEGERAEPYFFYPIWTLEKCKEMILKFYRCFNLQLFKHGTLLFISINEHGILIKYFMLDEAGV